MNENKYNYLANTEDIYHGMYVLNRNKVGDAR